MKLKVTQPGGGFWIFDYVANARCKPLAFESAARYRDYVGRNWGNEEDDALLECLTDEGGKPVDWAPEVNRIDVTFRNETEKALLVNTRAFLENDLDGGTIDIIREPRNRPKRAIMEVAVEQR